MCTKLLLKCGHLTNQDIPRVSAIVRFHCSQICSCLHTFSLGLSNSLILAEQYKWIRLQGTSLLPLMTASSCHLQSLSLWYCLIASIMNWQPDVHHEYSTNSHSDTETLYTFSPHYSWPRVMIIYSCMNEVKVIMLPLYINIVQLQKTATDWWQFLCPRFFLPLSLLSILFELQHPLHQHPAYYVLGNRRNQYHSLEC